jgi:5-methylcytosine-specific restriction protein A
MPDFAVITENDESQWDDRTGVVYHFPARYAQHLAPGTQVVYYKGRQRSREFDGKRLTDGPHYFGVAEMGRHWPDPASGRGNLFADVHNFRPFVVAVMATQASGYLEVIPPSRVTNYWRDGVRRIDQATYNRIVSLAQLGLPVAPDVDLNDQQQGDAASLESAVEGRPSQRFVTVYERDPRLRQAAIAVHGDTCFACGFNFEQFYGPEGAGFIHVHHRKPLAEAAGAASVNPSTDLVPLCANCHCMVHRRRSRTLEVGDLKEMIRASRGRAVDAPR